MNPATSIKLQRRLRARGHRVVPSSEALLRDAFSRHGSDLYRYALSIVRSPADAEDVLQTVMAKAAKQLGSSRELALRPWLYRVIHNESISLLRKRKRAPVAEVDLEAVAAASSGPVAAAERSERLRQLMVDLDALPERQRGALVMRELSGLDYEEIGVALSASVAAARQSVYEARIALQTLREGREMPCAEVKELISSEDARRLRSKRVQAHLRSCESCDDFQAAIAARGGDLRMLFPGLPAVAVGGLLTGALGAGGLSAAGAGAGSAAGTAGGASAAGGATAGGVGAAGAGTGAGAFGATTAGVAAKGAAVLAAAAIGIGGAEATEVVDLAGVGKEPEAATPTSQPAGATGAAGGEPAAPTPSGTVRGSSTERGKATAEGSGRADRGNASGKAAGRKGSNRKQSASGGGKPGRSADAPGKSKAGGAPATTPAGGGTPGPGNPPGKAVTPSQPSPPTGGTGGRGQGGAARPTPAPPGQAPASPAPGAPPNKSAVEPPPATGSPPGTGGGRSG